MPEVISPGSETTRDKRRSTCPREVPRWGDTLVPGHGMTRDLLVVFFFCFGFRVLGHTTRSVVPPYRRVSSCHRIVVSPYRRATVSVVIVVPPYRRATTDTVVSRSVVPPYRSWHNGYVFVVPPYNRSWRDGYGSVVPPYPSYHDGYGSIMPPPYPFRRATVSVVAQRIRFVKREMKRVVKREKWYKGTLNVIKMWSTNIFWYKIHLFTPDDVQRRNNILLPALGPLHLGIHRFPLELLVPAPLVEDGPASVRSKLKKGQYTKHK
jgi:hypothetical protein